MTTDDEFPSPDRRFNARSRVKQFALFAALLGFAALSFTRHAQAKTPGWISTCAGVGCQGGQEGCYWYQARGLELIMYCYGVRP